MRFMRNWAPSLLATLILAAPAAATPDQSVWINDTLFAATPDTVLVLRTITDNHGSYYTTQTDTFLLQLSRSDGAVQFASAVDRVIDISGLEAELDETNYEPLDSPVNPYAVRADLNAAPIGDIGANTYRHPMLHPNGLMVFEGEEMTHLISLDALHDQLATSITTTRAVLPVVYALNDYDRLDPPRIPLIADCFADRVTERWFAPYDEDAMAFVRLTCSNFDEGGISTYWVAVPATE